MCVCLARNECSADEWLLQAKPFDTRTIQFDQPGALDGCVTGFRVKDRERRVHGTGSKLLESRRIWCEFGVNIAEFHSGRFQGQLSNQRRPAVAHAEVHSQATQI